MLQNDLFANVDDNQIRFMQLIKDVQQIAIDIVKELGYPDGSLGVYENKTKSETNYPLQIRERRRGTLQEEYTGDKSFVEEIRGGLRLNYICTTIGTLVMAKPRSKNAGCVVLRIGSQTYKDVVPPSDALVKESGGLNRCELIIPLNSPELLKYLERLMKNGLLKYKSSEPSYGCCHLYQECSDAKRCVSPEKMYATVCLYRKNLESGRIFYGKNRNV